MVQRSRRRNAVKEARWRELVAAHQAGDLSVREFCRRERVPENSFYAWRRELTLRDAEGALAATSKAPAAGALGKAGGRKSRSSAQRPTFVPVTLAGPAGAPLVEVALARGTTLRVHAGCDAATLALVLAALEDASC